MPTPSKFTADRRREILRALELGASLRTAAACGGVDAATLTRWLQRGETAKAGSTWRKFADDVRAAKAKPNVRALQIVHDAMADKPDLAWKFLERRESGYAPPSPVAAPAAAAPVVINLTLGGRGGPEPVRNEALREVVDIEPHGLPAADPPESA